VHNKPLSLAVGHTYRFVFDSSIVEGSHPFLIKTSNDVGDETNVVTDGVVYSNDDMMTGHMLFTVTKETPQPLYYHCTCEYWIDHIAVRLLRLVSIASRCPPVHSPSVAIACLQTGCGNHCPRRGNADAIALRLPAKPRRGNADARPWR
jgi:hypothetical protein